MSKSRPRRNSNYARALEVRTRNLNRERMASARQLNRRAALRKLGKTLDDIYRQDSFE